MGDFGIDLISLWKILPGYLKLYSMFVFLSAILMLIRSVRIAFRLHSFWRPATVGNDHQIAASALRGITRAGESGAFERCDSEFQFQWETCERSVHGMIRWVVFTLLLSLTAIFWSIWIALTVVRPSAADAAGGPSCLIPPFAVALFVCAFVYGAASYFRGVLEHRRTEWNYTWARQMR